MTREEEEDQLTVHLIADLDRWDGMPCQRCGGPNCGHQVLFSVFLGLKNAPICLPCAAKQMERVPAEFRDDLNEHLRRRTCYRRAWAEASVRENVPDSAVPPCLQTHIAPSARAPSESTNREGEAPAEPTRTSAVEAIPEETWERWDAGSMACGELVLALRIRLGKMQPGDGLHVLASDPAAVEDLPAWCRLTGHRLVQSAPPHFWIQRKKG